MVEESRSCYRRADGVANGSEGRMMPGQAMNRAERIFEAVAGPVRPPNASDTTDWPAAHRQALEMSEPVFVRARHYCDDRGWSLMNLLNGAMSAKGQINFSCQYPGVIKGWHRHTRQTDFWMCAIGHIKAGIFREGDGRAWSMVLGEKNPGVLIIPPTLWHGAATVGAQPAGLLYYVTHAFDPTDPDEDRRAWDSVKGFNWHVEHR
jgi:dTDP-4-dehydrorhamnose 3,5-epimerase